LVTTYPPTASASLPVTIPGYPDWGILRELAEPRLDHPSAASLYLALHDGEPHIPRQIQQQEDSLIDELRKLVRAAEPEAPGHDARMTLRALPDRIGEHLRENRPSGRHVHGVACFANSAGALRMLELPESCGDDVALGRTYRLVPLTSLIPRTREAVIVMVGREQGRILLWASGALREIDDRFEEVHGRHDQGGWSQARYQRSIENDILQHLENVADGVNRTIQAERRPIVVDAVEEIRGDFMRYLEQHARDLIAGWTTVDPHATPNDVAAAAREVLSAWWADQERELVETWRAAAARHSGHGAAGFQETTEAAANGAVELLLYQDAPATQRRYGWECPECGRPAAVPGTCPLHGARLVPQPRALDAVVREVLRYGGKALAMGDHERLTAAEGIGAMMRYPAV
jgi:peptide chain release factor subunit 1